MTRRLLNLLTLVSMLLCATTAALWARTYHKPDDIVFSHRGVRWHVGSHHGRLQLDNVPQRSMELAQHHLEQSVLNAELQAELTRMINNPPVLYGPPDPRPDPRAELFAQRELMRRAQVKVNENSARMARLRQKQLGELSPPVKRSIPHAVVVPALAVLPTAWLTTRAAAVARHRRRKRRGCCLACGYDLTGNVSGGCPECGRAIGLAACSTP